MPGQKLSPPIKDRKKMNNTPPLPIVFRELRPDERPLLREFLLRAIYLPEGTPPPPPEIVESPELKLYFKDFGLHPADHALVAVVGEEVIGLTWCRRMHDFGYVDEQTPSLALSLREEIGEKASVPNCWKTCFNCCAGKAMRRSPFRCKKPTRPFASTSAWDSKNSGKPTRNTFWYASYDRTPGMRLHPSPPSKLF